MDPAIGFAALFKEFDTAVMGRKTYELWPRRAATVLCRCGAMMFLRALRKRAAGAQCWIASKHYGDNTAQRHECSGSTPVC